MATKLASSWMSAMPARVRAMLEAARTCAGRSRLASAPLVYRRGVCETTTAEIVGSRVAFLVVFWLLCPKFIRDHADRADSADNPQGFCCCSISSDPPNPRNPIQRSTEGLD